MVSPQEDSAFHVIVMRRATNPFRKPRFDEILQMIATVLLRQNYEWKRKEKEMNVNQGL